MANNSRCGRKLDFSWADVNKIETEGKLKAECKHCKILISSKIERIKAHLQKCAVLTKKRVAERADGDINRMSEIESCSSGGGSSSFFEESASTNVPIKRKRQAVMCLPI
uniref:Uncharacterized protein LOC114329185 isoform X2 n=1 Tax=Diabrotica virgifera virgifera TaxID=50390 RepID=A0A6P7FM02_DIAVI